MKPVLIFRHVDCEGPGYLQAFLDRHDIPYKLVCIDAGDPVPEDTVGVSGLVFMGGSMSVNDPHDWIGQELDLIGQALDNNVPVLGHCLGGQLIARSLGAAVGPNRVREFGWHPVNLEDNPETREWFGSDIATFESFHWHGERFNLPEGAVPLMSSEFCDNQAFVARGGRAMAMQCHIEMTADMVRTWSERFREQLAEPSCSIQSAGDMLIDLDERIRSLNHVANRVYEHWIKGLV